MPASRKPYLTSCAPSLPQLDNIAAVATDGDGGNATENHRDGRQRQATAAAVNCQQAEVAAAGGRRRKNLCVFVMPRQKPTDANSQEILPHLGHK